MSFSAGGNSMKINGYITLDENNKIIRFDTINIGDDSIFIAIDESLIDGLKILSCYYIDNQLVFSQEEYNKTLVENL